VFTGYFFDSFGPSFWPSTFVVLAGLASIFGSIAGLIGGIASSGTDYPDSYLERTFRGYETATPARRLGGNLLEGVLMLFTLGIGWLIWFAIVAPRGQTPAKSLVSTYVVRKDGTRAGGWYMWGRELGVKWLLVGVIDTFALGMVQLFGSLMIFWDRDKQCLWDKIVGSYVAYSPAGELGRDTRSQVDMPEELRELQRLHTEGVISADQYEVRRRRLMGGE
jgi:uncharacterized RDD family membrane protein YckC